MTAEETLGEWNRQLETVRAAMLRGGGKPGIAPPALVANKSGGLTRVWWCAANGS